ncbi:MAG: hypothetical protein HQL29_01955 [Candidatus Omnitrophica bacterium]|nr:hypothetical protein [Candidatus Omnitrophota bacterium]
MKKMLISLSVVLLVLFICLGIYSKLKTREFALDVRQTILNKEDFKGQTKDQILERFGKPKNFQNIGAVNKDGTSHLMEMLHYPALGIDMVVYLDNGIVTKVEYTQKQQKGYIVFTIDDVIVDNGQIQVPNPKFLPGK